MSTDILDTKKNTAVIVDPEPFDDKRAMVFLGELRKSPNVARAASVGGFSRTLAYYWRNLHVDFRDAWDAAIEESTDALVGESYRRAYEGTSKPVFYQGVECGAIQEFSDTLAIFLLKAHRRNVYGERVALTGENGGPIETKTKLDLSGVTDEQLEALAALLQRQAITNT